MSWSRLSSDACAYNTDLNQSVRPLQYRLDPVQFYRHDKCRNELGLLGGPAVSHVNANLLDVENDLIGLTRPATHCPSYQFQPQTSGDYKEGQEYIKPVCHPKIDMTLKHLPSCQMFGYASVPTSPLPAKSVCNTN